VFENRVLRKIFRPKRDEVTGEWRSCTVRNFIVCTHPQISLGLILCSDVVIIVGLSLSPPLFPFVGLVLLGRESEREREGG
jgi:hypothetical protein